MGKFKQEMKSFDRMIDEKFNAIIESKKPKKKKKDKKKEKPENDKFNILDDTIKTLKENGKTVEDVKWVGNKDFHMKWENFEALADVEIRHDEARNIAEDLVIVGDDWWLERDFWGLDGYFSGWAFKSKPKKPELKYLAGNLLTVDDYDHSLKKANERWFK